MQGKWIRRSEDSTNVVFVHGILSSGEDCWRHPNGVYWPELLPITQKLDKHGVYVFTYQTDIFSGGYSLDNVVDALKEFLKFDDVLSCQRLVFVCHSMGGIVVRKYIVERASDLADLSLTIGLFLVASPSLGSEYANLLSLLAKFLGHSQAQALQFSSDNQWLSSLDRQFQNLKESRRLDLHGKELIEDKFIVLKKWFRKQVVEALSGAKYFGDAFKVPKSDHFSISKPESHTAVQHRLLTGFISDLPVRHQSSGQPGDHGQMNPVGKHYISYVEADGAQFAEWVSEGIERASGKLQCWFSSRNFPVGRDYFSTVDAVLQRSASVILILTDSAVEVSSRCEFELRQAVSYNKPITIVKYSASAVVPLYLSARKCIEVLPSQEKEALQELVDRLLSFTTSEGQLEYLREQLASNRLVETLLGIKNPLRLHSESAALEQQISALEVGATLDQDRRHRLELDLERERVLSTSKADASKSQIRFVNSPPLPVPRYFQNRHEETGFIVGFLRDRAASVLTVHGRGGVGKTALVCRALADLENDTLPDGLGTFKAAAVVYINATSASANIFARIMSDLMMTLKPEHQKELSRVMMNPVATATVKLQAVLSRLGRSATIILLDNFEDLISPDDSKITNPEVAEFMRAVLVSVGHSLKIILTTRIIPRDFDSVSPARHTKISLSDGLVSPHAERVLRGLDLDGSAGLRNADEQLLTQVAAATRGFPRALEAFYSVIAADPSKDVNSVLDDLRKSSHEEEQLTQALVGEAYSRLLPMDCKVMEAIAIYGRPISMTAIEYVLEEWAPHTDLANALKRLVVMHFVRREGRAYYLHPIDRAHALNMLSENEIVDLRIIAASYYKEISRPSTEWNELEDVGPHLESFKFRVEAGDFRSASFILDDLADFLTRRGAFELLLSLANSLLKSSEDIDVICCAHVNISSALWRLGRIGDAIFSQRRVIEILGGLGRSTLSERGNLLIYKKELGVTEEILQSFRDFAKEWEDKCPGDVEGVANALDLVSQCLGELGYLDEALDYECRAIDVLKDKAEVDTVQSRTHNLGVRYSRLGDDSNAERLFKEALLLFDKNKNPLWKSAHLVSIAWCRLNFGDFDGARDHCENALRIGEDIGSMDMIIRSLGLCSEIYLHKGMDIESMSSAKRAYDLAMDFGKFPGGSRVSCVRVFALYREILKAKDMLGKISPVSGQEFWEFHNLSGAVFLYEGNIDDARSNFQQALEEADVWLSRSNKNRMAAAARALALSGLGTCGDSARASEAAAEYQQLFERNKQLPGLIKTWQADIGLLPADVRPMALNQLLEASPKG